MIYADELDGAVLTFTRRAPGAWRGYARRVDAAMLAEVAPPPAAKPRCFVCGPTGFVEQVATALVELGHHPALIKTERFGASVGFAAGQSAMPSARRIPTSRFRTCR